jgi:peptidoglycan/xylan/chitin deacetylase (PgdA/CDA1 family)
MNALAPLSNTRGIHNLISRIISVFNRFSLKPKRFEDNLYRYNATAQSMGCKPTFGITAVTLARHPESIKRLSKLGAEFAVHGYIHTDYYMLSEKEQSKHFKKAINTFESCGIPFVGFRAPYLRINGKSPQTLSDLGFIYDSSHPIHWEVIEKHLYSENKWRQYDRLLDYYDCRNSECHLALPKLTDRLIEIPVSIPDDEMLIDRLGIKDKKEIFMIWRSILQDTYERGELFTLSFHPERIFYCENALSGILEYAQNQQLHVWMATLQEIAEWWKEKNKFDLEITSEGNYQYIVQARCSPRATLLIRNCKASAPSAAWTHGYEVVSARDFRLESPVKPVIGINPQSSISAENFLRSEGFVIERSNNPENYGIYLDGMDHFQESDEKAICDKIDDSTAPLVRYWRWPDSARSALSVTGDIDSITLIDFCLRILENFVQNLKTGRRRCQ